MKVMKRTGDNPREEGRESKKLSESLGASRTGVHCFALPHEVCLDQVRVFDQRVQLDGAKQPAKAASDIAA